MITVTLRPRGRGGWSPDRDMNATANEWGCPWHAFHGYRHDAHYWAWVAAVVVPVILGREYRVARVQG